MKTQSWKFIYLFFFISFYFFVPLYPSTKLENHGLFASWLTWSKSEEFLTQIGARFLPEFSISHNLSSSEFIEGEISINVFGISTFSSSGESLKGKIKPYRLNLKYSSPRFEAKLGLQKISFGSASLLRPLMWFDRLDPRDPAQITDGVYALLLRSFVSEKTNFWFWILYGNKETKGLEIFPSDKKSPEFGLRAQIPAGEGELAFSFHHRKAFFPTDFPPEDILLDSSLSSENFPFPEERYAIDGKWDIGIGIWFEAVFTNQRTPYFIYPWQRSFTTGMDYTFSIGNGIHFLTEYFFPESSKKIFSKDGTPYSAKFFALSLSYPLSFLDNLSAMVFYDTKSKDFYTFARWQRTYDKWSINLMIFSNPEEFKIYRKTDENFFAGKGFLLMVIYNY